MLRFSHDWRLEAFPDERRRSDPFSPYWGGRGFYVYALQQWDAARTEVMDGRPVDAGRPQDRFFSWVWPYSTPVHLLAARRAAADGKLCRGPKRSSSDAFGSIRRRRRDVQIEFLLMPIPHRTKWMTWRMELFRRVD